MKLARKADRIAAKIAARTDAIEQATVRDECDVATGSELSASLLDRLAAMVVARLRRCGRST